MSILAALRANTKKRLRLDAQLKEVIEERDNLIRQAFAAHEEGRDIAQAAGVRIARTYQIRDGRR
ncbi:hypothetical protein [Nocardia sp. NPDC057030]|uniref:hypothetical protein n=1 Tax=unclassified Nocardia TaxID=2637762 RepID=UPI00363BB811